MAQIHPNWVLSRQEGSDRAALVKAAKRPRQKPPIKPGLERAVNQPAETRRGRS